MGGAALRESLNSSGLPGNHSQIAMKGKKHVKKPQELQELLTKTTYNIWLVVSNMFFFPYIVFFFHPN
jgi:hypothetical protein